MGPTPAPVAIWSRARASLKWVLLALAAAIALWPALRPVHTEGFSASIVAIGLHLRQGTLLDFIPFAPFNTDYYGLTKLGAVYGVTALSPLFGGDGAMRAQMWLGAVLTIGASAVLARRWSGASWLVVGVALLLLPGVAESFYFFNDNVPAAGLMLSALALWSRRPTYPIAVVAGVLIGYAVTIRTDTALVAVVAMPLAALESRSFREMIPRTAVAGGVALLVLTAAFALVRTTPLDALHAGAIAVKLWARPDDLLRHAIIAMLYLSLPALLLAVFGTIRLVRTRRWARMAIVMGVPMAINVLLAGKMWEVRQFLVLSPFIAALVAMGVQTLVDDWRRAQRVGPIALVAMTLLWMAAPARGVILSDGPRVLSGRIAGLRLWSAWQQAVRDDFGRIDAVIASAPPNGTLAVVTDGWNDDRYLHLLLVEKGFRRSPEPPPCGAIGEAMTAGGRTVVALSIRQTVMPSYPALNAQRLERYAVPCLAATRPANTVLLMDSVRTASTFGTSDRELPPLPPEAPMIRRILATPLDAKALAVLDAAYRREAAAYGPAETAEAAMAQTQSRTAFSR